MRILFVGDIVGRPGRRVLIQQLDHVVVEQRIDLVVANCENSAAGFGVTPSGATGVLLLELVDEAGAAKAGVPGGQLVVAGGVEGPFFLDANLAPDDAACSEFAQWRLLIGR